MKQTTFQCAHCGNKMRQDALDSMPPEENTPAANISIVLGSINFSLLCDNPKCYKYTITCIHPQEFDRLTQKYKAQERTDSNGR
jgi:hypothetical protein